MNNIQTRSREDLIHCINKRISQLLDNLKLEIRSSQWLFGKDGNLKKFHTEADNLLKNLQKLSPECRLEELQVGQIADLCCLTARDLVLLSKVNELWKITRELLHAANMPVPSFDGKFSDFFKIEVPDEEISDVSLVSMSNMLDVACLPTEWIEHHTGLLASALTRELTEVPAEGSAPADRLFWTAKVFMQTCQSQPVEIKAWSRQRAPDSRLFAQHVLTGLWRIICGKGASSDICHMSSLALVTFLKASSEDADDLRVNANSLMTFLLSGANSTFQETSILIGPDTVCVPPPGDCSQSECVFAICCYCRAVLKVFDGRILLFVSKDQPCLMERILEAICSIQNKILGAEYQFILLLTTWFDSLVRHKKEQPWQPSDTFWSMLEVVSQLMWCQVNSPVPGAQEQLMRSYQALMKILISEMDKGNSKAVGMHQRLLQSVLSAPAHMKARYLVIGALVQFFGPSEVLSHHPELPGELMSCMDTNHLHSAAELVYKQAIAGLTREHGDQEELLGEWIRIWGDGILRGLCSSSNLFRSHVCNYFIPLTLKIISGSLPTLLSSVNALDGVSDARKLHASLMIIKQAKMRGLLTDEAKIQQAQILSAGLCHLDDDIRSDAFSLLVQSRHSSQAFTSSELRQLKDFVYDNLNSDNTAVRNGFITGIKNSLYRIRDGSSALVRKLTALSSKKANATASEKDELHRQLLEAGRVVDGIFHMCLSSLFPGACYQRMRSALDILTHLFQCFLKSISDSKKIKKGISEDVRVELLRLLQAEGLCQFISARSASHLLPCLLVSSGDLRSSAFQILTEHFPWPLPYCEAYPWIEPTELLCLGMKLINSPRVQECESGALLCKMSFMKTTIEKDMHMRDIFPKDSFNGVVVKSRGRSADPTPSIFPVKHDDPVFHFLQSLLDSLKFQFESFQQNPLIASATTPMYGIVVALSKCVIEVPRSLIKLNDESSENATSLVKELLDTLFSICRFVLKLLSGRMVGNPGEGNSDNLVKGSPSFSEMTVAINEMMANLSHHPQSEEDSLPSSSSEHQLIFSCSWLSLKHCSQLLGQISVLVCQSDEIHGLMDTSQHISVANLLVDILIQCRHKAVIDNCALAVSKLSSACLNSAVDTNLQGQPRVLLEMALDLVLHQESSFTKKSAGLPLLVEAIITAEPRQRERELLKHAICRLLEIANMPLLEQYKDSHDLPQTSALNVLGSLFRASGTAEDIRPYISDVLKFTIRGFAFSSFVLRNCCMQLFGVLVARLFGQKKVTDEHSIMNSICVEEFFSRHGDMKDFLLDEIAAAANDLKSEDSVSIPLRPTLQPVLVILSKLGPGLQEQNDGRLYKAFQESLLILLSSPLYFVRRLVPRAILAFIPPSETSIIIHQLIDGLPSSPNAPRNHNKLHGELLLIRKLIEIGSIQSLQEIGIKLSAGPSWIGQDRNPCAWTRAAFINVLKAVLSKTCEPPDEAIRLSQHIITQCLEQGFLYQICESELCSAVVDLTSVVAGKGSTEVTSIGEMSVKLLAHPSLDMRLAATKSLQSSLWALASKGDLAVLVESAFGRVMGETCATNLGEALNLCHSLYSRTKELSLEWDVPHWPALYGFLLSLANGSRGSMLRSCSLPVLSAFYVADASSQDIVDWHEWISLITTSSNPTQSETSRHAAVRSLNVAAAKCFAVLSSSAEETKAVSAVSLLQCIYSLLQDEQREIRQATATFVNILVNKEPPSSRECHQVNHMLKEVMLYFCDKFSWSQSALDLLFVWLQGSPGDSVDALREQTNDRVTNLFEQISSNIYRESVIETEFIAAGIETLIPKLAELSPDLVRSWLNQKYAATIQEVKLTTEALAKTSVADLFFFGATGYEKPYQSIYRLLRSLTLLQTITRSLTMMEALKCHLDEIEQKYEIIMQMRHIHPLLREDHLLPL